MLGVYQDNLRRWKEEAEIDYFAYFIKAYIPFNTWFRHSYPHLKHEFEILSNLKSDGNTVRSGIIGLLESDDEDARRFKTQIGLLHQRLDANRLTAKRGLITFTDCYVGDNLNTSSSETKNNFNYKADKVSARQFSCSVTRRTTLAPIFSCPTHNGYNLETVRAAPGFAALSAQQRSKLEWHYEQINPQIVVNLLDTALNVSRPAVGLAPSRGGVTAPRSILMNTTHFCDNPSHIFGGLVEVLYALRCQLFHGEIVPTRAHNEVYEPAYFILRRFLGCIV